MSLDLGAYFGAVLMDRFAALVRLLYRAASVYRAVTTVHGAVAIDALGDMSVHVAHLQCVVQCSIEIGIDKNEL
jgi:hypothetical protein